ncbi:TPA: hypothetical protein PFE08_004486 [Kluyvera ascorbata]|nr:hypothetical protein [Kluyvera ascorbata]
MAVCPFCRSHVHDQADICSSCNAEKVTTFRGNFDHSIKAMRPILGMFGMVGIILGLLIGFSVGMKTVAFLGWVSGVIVFLLVMFAPALLRTAVVCRNGKVQWYR